MGANVVPIPPLDICRLKKKPLAAGYKNNTIKYLP